MQFHSKSLNSPPKIAHNLTNQRQSSVHSLIRCGGSAQCNMCAHFGLIGNRPPLSGIIGLHLRQGIQVGCSMKCRFVVFHASVNQWFGYSNSANWSYGCARCRWKFISDSELKDESCSIAAVRTQGHNSLLAVACAFALTGQVLQVVVKPIPSGFAHAHTSSTARPHLPLRCHVTRPCIGPRPIENGLDA